MQSSSVAFGSAFSTSHCNSVAGLPLAALSGKQLCPKFHSWFGASGKRYVCSVFVGADFGAMEAVRSYSEAIVLAVRCDANGVKSVVGVGDIGHIPDLFWRGAAMVELVRSGVEEFHIHLMAETGVERQKIVQDILGNSRH